MWKHLGLRREDLINRPWREVEDYMLYIEMIAREEAVKAAMQQPKGAGYARG